MENKNHFIKILKNKVRYEYFTNLKSALMKIIYNIKNEKNKLALLFFLVHLQHRLIVIKISKIEEKI